jgi:hypothetical protein
MVNLPTIPPSEYQAAALKLSPALFSVQAGILPDPWQKHLLLSRSKRIMLNCSRQSGKSTTLGTLSLHTAIYQPGSLVLMVSKNGRQSGELFKKCTAIYKALGRPVPFESETALTLTLANGSRIVSLPGGEGGIRGYSSVHTLIVDEASRVPDDLYFAIRPMLAVSKGRMITASTPFGTRGWWYENYYKDQQRTQFGEKPRWEYYEVPAEECPRITPEFLAEEKAELGEFWFEQEYHCQFLDAQSAAFRETDIRQAFSEEIETWEM